MELSIIFIHTFWPELDFVSKLTVRNIERVGHKRWYFEVSSMLLISGKIKFFEKTFLYFGLEKVFRTALSLNSTKRVYQNSLYRDVFINSWSRCCIAKKQQKMTKVK